MSVFKVSFRFFGRFLQSVLVSVSVFKISRYRFRFFFYMNFLCLTVSQLSLLGRSKICDVITVSPNAQQFETGPVCDGTLFNGGTGSEYRTGRADRSLFCHQHPSYHRHCEFVTSVELNCLHLPGVFKL